MLISHADKVAAVTGGGAGIGRAISIQLASEGAHVAVLDTNEQSAAEVVDTIRANGGSASAHRVDVRSRNEIQRTVEEVHSANGRIDLLVNNAGVITMTDLADLTDDEWDLVIDVNLKGPFLMSQVASRVMNPGGAVVNLATIESEVVVSSSGSCQVHYNASKGGVKMLTKALAVELAKRDIRVNAVAPGPINTGFSGSDLDTPEAMSFLSQRLLITRSGRPEDIAQAVSFLLSDQASFITGITLPVDGGWLTR